jgi:cytochrome c biogenesis protein CcmG, thiol:disulfide interchange protein DsbE
VRTVPAASLILAILMLLPATDLGAAASVGQAAPALVVQELSGQTFDLASQRGKVVIVSFWATWCPPCRKEMPILDAFYRKYHPQGLEMIGVSVDRPRDASEVRNVMQSFGYPAAMLDDAKVNDFGTPTALPVAYVIDSQGIVRAEFSPDQTPVTEQGLTQLVVPLLVRKPAGQPPSVSSQVGTQRNSLAYTEQPAQTRM